MSYFYLNTLITKLLFRYYSKRLAVIKSLLSFSFILKLILKQMSLFVLLEQGMKIGNASKVSI